MTRLFAAGLLGLCLWAAAPAWAATPEEAANRMSSEIMSPFCPGVTLHECPSREALRLRDRIESWFAAGLSERAVMARLEAEYGSNIRAVPPAEGAGLLGWIGPAAALAIALGVGAWLVRKWTRAETKEVTTEGITGSDRTRIDEELAALRGNR